MKKWRPEDIKKLREKCNLSQPALGNLVGVSGNYIYLLEKGVKKPSEALKKLFNLVEVEYKMRNLGQKKGGQMTNAFVENVRLQLSGSLERTGRIFQLVEETLRSVKQTHTGEPISSDYHELMAYKMAFELMKLKIRNVEIKYLNGRYLAVIEDELDQSKQARLEKKLQTLFQKYGSIVWEFIMIPHYKRR